MTYYDFDILLVHNFDIGGPKWDIAREMHDFRPNFWVSAFEPCPGALESCAESAQTTQFRPTTTC